MNDYHKPVLVNEVIEALHLIPHGVYIDATFGGGGHSRAILDAEPTCRVIAFDWDKIAIETHAAEFEQQYPGRISFVWANFAQLQHHVKKMRLDSVQGILADFGTSSFQIKARSGFSFSHNSDLDMRMSPAHQQMTAAMLVASLSEKELADIFWTYGEERYAREVARAIVLARRRRSIDTTNDLASLVEGVVPRIGKIHPATRIFQALRIAVNKEIDNIVALLHQAKQVLVEGGRLVCISFHSLEDREVKHFVREHAYELRLVNKKVIVPQPDEISANPASRSARLRAIEKKKI